MDAISGRASRTAKADLMTANEEGSSGRSPEGRLRFETHITREQLDCFRRDIHSGHPVFSTRAIQILRLCIEGEGSFDCEATRLNALNLYNAVTSRQ
jgi:hypothetical protein